MQFPCCFHFPFIGWIRGKNLGQKGHNELCLFPTSLFCAWRRGPTFEEHWPLCDPQKQMGHLMGLSIRSRFHRNAYSEFWTAFLLCFSFFPAAATHTRKCHGVQEIHMKMSCATFIAWSWNISSEFSDSSWGPAVTARPNYSVWLQGSPTHTAGL